MSGKTEKIDSIQDIDKLAVIVKSVLSKMKLSSIERVSKCVISAKEKSILKERKIYFLLTLSELNGKVQPILDIVNSINDEVDNLYIISSSRKISNYFKKWIKSETKIADIDYWSRDELITIIDKKAPDYWAHNDSFLMDYEKWFNDSLAEDLELKKLLKLDDKYDGLLNFFIEPKLYVFGEDKETKNPVKTRVKIDYLLKENNHIISGEAGTGKSTLLKEIARKIIEKNKAARIKTIPVYLKSSDLLDANFNVWLAIDTKLKNTFTEFEISNKLTEYNIALLIDSIDEFEYENKITIVTSISELWDNKISRFIICTRNYDALIDGCELCNHDNPFILNFDLRQVKAYLDHFFKFDLAKSDKLWEILIENNTLEKIPVTPLTISLISILYEDKGYEIPATITDVYDNFSLFLLGRLNVSSRLDFLDINIKERLLSTYSLEVINSINKKKKNKDEFVEFIRDFFARKSITINEELVPELLKSLTDRYITQTMPLISVKPCH